MVEIKEVEGKSELRKFVEFPSKLYEGNPYYVPDLLSSRMEDYDPKRNPAFEYCDAKCFLAYRDGEIVGRIGAIHNTKANEKFGKNYLTFSAVDFIDDDEVVDALFETAAKWGKDNFDCTVMHGPLGFSDMDPEGMLVEGFDRQGLYYTYYNYPYYKRQLERMGFEKEVDWIECRITIPEERNPKITRIAEAVIKRQNLRVVDLKTKGKPLKALARDMFDLWNVTYEALFGVVPMTERQVKKYMDEFRPLLDDRTTVFVYNDKDQMVGFGICSPSLERAQKKNGGRLFPFGWIPMLQDLKGSKNDCVDLLLIAVHPEYQGRGINAVVLDSMHQKLLNAGFKYAETGPMLELNDRVLAQWKYYPLEQHKRRRCWVKSI